MAQRLFPLSRAIAANLSRYDHDISTAYVLTSGKTSHNSTWGIGVPQPGLDPAGGCKLPRPTGAHRPVEQPAQGLCLPRLRWLRR
jgi:hypothetical protein